MTDGASPRAPACGTHHDEGEGERQRQQLYAGSPSPCTAAEANRAANSSGGASSGRRAGRGKRAKPPAPSDASARGMSSSASAASILAPHAAGSVSSASSASSPPRPSSAERGYYASSSRSVERLQRERERSRGASCSEYLSWRRQVNDLISLPAPVRGVPSSASWGLLPEARHSRATAPRTVGGGIAGRGTERRRQPPATAPGHACGGYARSPYRRQSASGGFVSSVESEFAQNAAELQSEVDDLLGDLTRHLNARGASEF